MLTQDGSELFTVPLELAGCMNHFKNGLPTPEEEDKSLKKYYLTRGDNLCDP
jgi:hypothetical protein